MIVLHVTYHCKTGKRYEYLKQILEEGIDAGSRAEEGNRQYNFYVPVDSEKDLLLLEKWVDDEALDAHREEPHYKRLAELKAECVEETKIEKFYVE